MYCRDIKLPDGTPAIVCGMKPKPLPKCEFCRRRDGENLCDYKTGGPCKKCKGSGERSMTTKEAQFHKLLAQIVSGEVESSAGITKEGAAGYMEAFTADIVCYWCSGSGEQNCNRAFCGHVCGIRLSDKEGYCPDHMELSGHKRKLVRERCEWQEALTASKCLRRNCTTEVQQGERCLYFPERQRAMHESCGSKYLSLATAGD